MVRRFRVLSCESSAVTQVARRGHVAAECSTVALTICPATPILKSILSPSNWGLMNAFKVSLSALISVMLTACASTSGSSFSPSESASSASVKAYWNRESLSVWEGYELLSVDNKFISYGMFLDPTTATTKIEPGQRKIVISVRFNKGYGTGPFEALVPMDVELKPTVQYQLKGMTTGTTVEAWLELASTGEKASNVYTAMYGKSAPAPVAIPIFIPAR